MGLMVFEIMVKIVLAGNSNSEVEVFGQLPSKILLVIYFPWKNVLSGLPFQMVILVNLK